MPPQPGGTGDRSSMMPAAEAGRKALISFAPELLAAADRSVQRRACVARFGPRGMALAMPPNIKWRRQFDCVAPP
ncbi:hypothetical protein CK221_05720 [Mesorhizobium sp. WSM3868]|nr:hypothetical protein CK221_05720 [Mesorhizobium sp. WSM3868]